MVVIIEDIITMLQDVELFMVPSVSQLQYEHPSRLARPKWSALHWSQCLPKTFGRQTH